MEIEREEKDLLVLEIASIWSGPFQSFFDAELVYDDTFSILTFSNRDTFAPLTINCTKTRTLLVTNVLSLHHIKLFWNKYHVLEK